jgi:excisionase family DNA binding protein
MTAARQVRHHQPMTVPTATVPRLLTLADAAKRTGASESFWRREVRLRRIRAYRLGDLVRIAETDLEAYLAARRTEPAAEAAK